MSVVSLTQGEAEGLVLESDQRFKDATTGVLQHTNYLKALRSSQGWSCDHKKTEDIPEEDLSVVLDLLWFLVDQHHRDPGSGMKMLVDLYHEASHNYAAYKVWDKASE